MLQTYLDDMTKLFFVKESQTVTEDPEVIARVKTLTTLRQLDSGRKGIVIQFLSKARLIEGKLVTGHDPTISLHSADLSGISTTHREVLAGADLHDADLRYVDLSGAFLQGADLSGANLSDAFLRGADLRGATLDNTILKSAVYNTKEIRGRDSQGKIVDEIPPTKWPKGFDYKAAGATDVSTVP